MREIKFRVWDKRENVIRSLQALWSNGHVYVYCNCDAEGEHLYHRDKSRGGLAHHLTCRDVDLMQYTGLKDRNGKEIYEGDVVRDCSASDLTFEVEWNDDNVGYYMPPEFDEEYRFPISEVDLEVIGNIYENPELLKPRPDELKHEATDKQN